MDGRSWRRTRVVCVGEAAGESAAVRIVQVRPGKRLCVWMCVACRPAGQSTTPLRAPEHQAVVEQTSRPLKPVRVTAKKGVKRRRRSAGDVVDRAGERGGRELRRW